MVAQLWVSSYWDYLVGHLAATLIPEWKLEPNLFLRKLNVKESRYPNNERKADKRDLEKKLYDQIQETLHCKEEIRSLNSDVKSLDKELTQERNAILLKNKSWKRRFASWRLNSRCLWMGFRTKSTRWKERPTTAIVILAWCQWHFGLFNTKPRFTAN